MKSSTPTQTTGKLDASHPASETTRLWPAILLPATAAANAEVLAALPAGDWNWLATQAQRHTLAPLLYANLQPLSLNQPHAGPALETLRTAYKHSLLTAMRREGELRCILDGLAAQGICPGVFKGAALAYTIYPTPGCRPMGDIDLWVTHTEMPAAIKVLTALGYRLHEKTERPHALTQSTDGEVQMRPTQPGQHLVELHWGVFAGEWLARTTAIDRAGVRSRLMRTPLTGGREVLLLAPEDALIQLAVHLGINHQMSLHALRSLVDITLLAQQRPIDWDVVVTRARTWRVATVVGLALTLADTCFDLPALAAPAAELAPAGPQRRLLAHFVDKQIILERPDLSSGKARFAYLLSMTDRRRDSLRLLWRTLWPESAWLAARYGQADMRTRIHHAGGALRGDI
jgi:hypothetical protein